MVARKKLDTLTEQMYYLLLALYAPGHGYAVMERVREMSRGRLQLGPGTLYTLLARFEKEGLITLALRIDTSITAVMDYFEIFLGRMMLCRKSAEILGTTVKRTFAIRFATCS